MLRFIWINLIGIIYFTSMATSAFMLFLIILTPIVYMFRPGGIDWLVFSIIAILALGYPIAFAKSYKSMIADLRDVWKSVKLR